MFDIIKTVIIPALKDEVEKGCKEWIDYTLYHESYDFNKVTPGVGSSKRIRVIGRIITIY